MCIFFLCFSCNRAHHEVAKGFYYWKTIYKPTPYELKRLTDLGCHSIYIRLCDLDWNKNTKQVQPLAPINFQQKIDTSFQYTPVLFITQQVLINTIDSNISGLAYSIDKLIEGLCIQASIKPHEIQIDCDWTGSTKEKYFNLLKQLQKQLFFQGRQISCTIRMHQAKYTLHNGIPPVDKGLLMCYNMGDIKKPGSHNSILDVDDAKDYLKYINNYPLPLDIALPLFDWCLLFRNNKWMGILRGVTPSNIKQTSFFKQKEDNLYTCRKDTTYCGYHFMPADEVRIETSSFNDLKSIATFTSDKIKNHTLSVVFFHCDSTVLSNFPNYELEKIYGIYN
ncbi:MAG: hypothetical protein JSS96_11655 [Bacteroidetes bacterium]|nr:hypothetical protein [Bacteroidota bacterium]